MVTPISKNRISVGLVINEERLREEQKNATNDEIFEAYLQLFPRVQKRLTSAKPIGKMRVESNFCYYADSLTGPDYLLVGDSGCFVDPMFSGGVFLAMATGMKAGKTLDQILNKQNSQQQLLQHYENFYNTGYDTYLRFLYWFYESNCDFYKALNSIPTEHREGISQ
ncbi:tryptophan 7-halogenase [Bacillus cereus]|uniref:tryptophan 7-halogenase n=1 Tax=Bacillus thuringiensis TaxID=1428 RepID=UPI000676E7AC|nr:tryptophan 7-halogenase [Bacillus thuringiensis]MEB8879377.1 tryptophan 7-halogenase [Bacillus cereus]AKR38941.1 Tryptophan 2-halogenase [Bacillus thuringiensis serovar indiana]MEB9619364.1 tryptophan 7-halogenase [Bacillus cereus]MEB9640618.1 tryptophan 7-halogenase [Bacillus cereus]MEB9643983.1 tryptophan 7-halogenase [Bacillus cereus]